MSKKRQTILSSLALLVLAGCGSVRVAAPLPASSPPVAASTRPGWLPIDQRRVVELVTFGTNSMRTQSIPTFVPGAEIGLIHVVQQTDLSKAYPTRLEVLGETGGLVWSAGGSGNYDAQWQGLDGSNNPLAGGTYTVKLKKAGSYKAAHEEPDGTLGTANIAITQLTLQVIPHEGLDDPFYSPSPS